MPRPKCDRPECGKPIPKWLADAGIRHCGAACAAMARREWARANDSELPKGWNGQATPDSSVRDNEPEKP